jgi:ElaB/YqjD/DUF883 family membrane-anchored ribosome-binding protein
MLKALLIPLALLCFGASCYAQSDPWHGLDPEGKAKLRQAAAYRMVSDSLRKIAGREVLLLSRTVDRCEEAAEDWKDAFGAVKLRNDTLQDRMHEMSLEMARCAHRRDRDHGWALIGKGFVGAVGAAVGVVLYVVIKSEMR